MRRGYSKFVLAALPAVFVSVATAAVVKFEENTGLTSKKTAGIRFAVPEDCPIVKRGGGYAPVTNYEYVYSKFRAVDDRLKTIEEYLRQMGADIEDIEKSGIDKKLTSITEEYERQDGLAGSRLQTVEDQLKYLQNMVEAKNLSGLLRPRLGEIEAEIRAIKSRLDGIESVLEALPIPKEGSLSIE